MRFSKSTNILIAHVLQLVVDNTLFGRQLLDLLINFGAIFPTAVAWFIVRPLKGLPVADVFRVPGIFIGPIVNGLWGLGTALFLSWMPGSAARAQ